MLLLLRTSYTTHCWMLLVHWHTFTSIYFSPKTTPVLFSLYGQSFFLTLLENTTATTTNLNEFYSRSWGSHFYFHFVIFSYSFPLEIFFLKFSQSKFLCLKIEAFFWMNLINFLIKVSLVSMHKSFYLSSIKLTFIIHDWFVCQKNIFFSFHKNSLTKVF